MEIAGSRCTVCERNVVFAEEGKCCTQCGIVVHQGCDSQSTCARCGRPYEVHQRPVADPIGDAVVPRSLRPNSPAAPVAIILIAALLLILMLLLFVMLLRGH